MIKEDPWINCEHIARYEYSYVSEIENGSNKISVPQPKWIKKFSNGARVIIGMDGNCSTIAPGWLLGVAVPTDKEAALSPEWWDNQCVRDEEETK